MKRDWKGFTLGFLVAVLLFALVIPAVASTVKQINATYKDIKITLDGVQIVPKDANGNAIEPFVSGGTTYLPIRGIANALGLGVDWDGKTNTVILQTKKEEQKPEPPKVDNWKITYQDCNLSESSIGKEANYDAIVEIENTGTSDLYLKDATFDFEDKSGHLLETKSFVSADPEIIAPGEKGYFYSSGSLEKVGLNTEYVFVPSLKVEQSKNSIIRYEISDTSKENTSYGVNITGRVKNTTDKDDSLVWVAFVLYRADGTPIIAGGTNITSLGAGETASFSRTFYKYEFEDIGADMSEVASYKVFACKTQYQ